MNKSARLLAAVLACLALIATTSGGSRPGNGRRAEPAGTPAAAVYVAELAGDSSGGGWSGHERVTFGNASAEPLHEVFLRLWGNAHGGCTAPSVTVTHLAGATAGDLSVGCTALRIALPAPLGHGRRHTVGFDLTIRAPERTDDADRFGRHGAYSYFGNALPVLAVRDTTGWHLDPFTDTGESFYTLAADFTVVLDHPAALGVPATGSSSDSPGASGRTVTTATARKVRDFAWAAGRSAPSPESPPTGSRSTSTRRPASPRRTRWRCWPPPSPRWTRTAAHSARTRTRSWTPSWTTTSGSVAWSTRGSSWTG